jgi:hypothetical protein
MFMVLNRNTLFRQAGLHRSQTLLLKFLLPFLECFMVQIHMKQFVFINLISISHSYASTIKDNNDLGTMQL